MSRWAERFTALSRSHDKSDNSDKRSSDDPGSPSVANCQNCHDKRSAGPSTPKPAEILTSAEGAQPSVTIVAFVKETDGEGGTQPRAAEQFSPTVPTIADKRPGDYPQRGRKDSLRSAAMPPPTGFSPERWQRIIDATGVFLDRWAGEASCCGWSDLDVFGCHDTAPAARFDCMGLVLMLDRREVVAIDRDGADLVTVQAPASASAADRCRPQPCLYGSWPGNERLLRPLHPPGRVRRYRCAVAPGRTQGGWFEIWRGTPSTLAGEVRSQSEVKS